MADLQDVVAEKRWREERRGRFFPLVMTNCKRCKSDKPDDEFYPGRLNRECKECTKARVSAAYHGDPAYRAKSLASSQRSKLKKYGLTTETYEDMVREQGDTCKMCGSSETGWRHRWCIDHCHDTGKVRGLLCYRCNTALGYYEDPSLHEDAMIYLGTYG